MSNARNPLTGETFSEKLDTANTMLAAIAAQSKSKASPFDEAPMMDGAARPGEAKEYARGDHVHPHDSTKVDVSDYDPVAATPAMTQPVGKDASGRLFTAPGGGSSGVVKVGSITLSPIWTGSDPYTQTVTVTGVTTTNNSLISIQPSNALLDQMETEGCKSLRIDNVNGVITAVARGAALTSALTIQVTVTEVTV